MLYLDVPFTEKDAAKRLGARWNPNMKKWYVEKRFDYPKFAKWILNGEGEMDVICDHVFLVVGQRKCYRCGNDIPVITFAIEKYCHFWNEDYYEEPPYYEWNRQDIHITPDMPDILDIEEYRLFSEYLDECYNYHLGYSRTVGSSYMANHCLACNSLQGDFFLNQEVDSPFFVDSPEKAAQLTLYRINLPYDKLMDLRINLSSADWMLKQFATIKVFDWN